MDSEESARPQADQPAPASDTGTHADAVQPVEAAADTASTQSATAAQDSVEPSEPEVLGPEEDDEAGMDRTPIWAGVLLLVALVVGGVIFAVNRHSSTPSTSSAVATPPSTSGPVPTQPVPPTPTIKGGSVAAIVNGHSIPTSQYRVYLDFAAHRSTGQPGVTTKLLGQQAMHQVILDEIVREYAASHGISVSNSQINAEIAKFRAQNGGDRGFTQWLTQLGLNRTTFRQLLGPSLLQEKVAARVAPVPSAHVRHILIGTNLPGKPVKKPAVARAEAERLLQQIQHGASFAALARAHSDDPGSKVKGGDLGNVFPHEMVPQFDRAAFTLQLHKPTLVQSQYGFHIVEVLSRTNNAKLPTNPQEQQAFQTAQQPVFNTWLNGLMKRAKIKQLVTAA